MKTTLSVLFASAWCLTAQTPPDQEPVLSPEVRPLPDAPEIQPLKPASKVPS